MDVRSFRFGAILPLAGSSRSDWRARLREVEDLGYNILQVPDHLGMAPFPALVAASDVTRIRLGTYVLNGGILSPAYLARDVADTYHLTDGRPELGLGAGYVPDEFTAAGLPSCPASWPARPGRSLAPCCVTARNSGISYISVLQDHMRTFAEVIPLLR